MVKVPVTPRIRPELQILRPPCVSPVVLREADDQVVYIIVLRVFDIGTHDPFQEGEGLHHHVEGRAPEPQFLNFRPEIVKFLCPGGELEILILMAAAGKIDQRHINEVRLQLRIQGVHTDGPGVP